MLLKGKVRFVKLCQLSKAGGPLVGGSSGSHSDFVKRNNFSCTIQLSTIVVEIKQITAAVTQARALVMTPTYSLYLSIPDWFAIQNPFYFF